MDGVGTPQSTASLQHAPGVHMLFVLINQGVWGLLVLQLLLLCGPLQCVPLSHPLQSEEPLLCLHGAHCSSTLHNCTCPCYSSDNASTGGSRGRCASGHASDVPALNCSCSRLSCLLLSMHPTPHGLRALE